MAPGQGPGVAGARAVGTGTDGGTDGGAGRPTFAVGRGEAPGAGSAPEPTAAHRHPVALAVSAPVQAQPPKKPSPSPSPAPLPPPETLAPPPGASQPAPPPAPSTPRFVASFEGGLRVWNTVAGGDLAPLVVTVPAEEGSVHAFAFSLYVERFAYGEPGVDNLVMQLGSDASTGRSFGLQLWDDWRSGERGFWASGEAVGEDRFLAPVSERVWHDVVVHFATSSQGAGFYEVYLDGSLIDAGSGVSLIAPGSSYAQIEVGLFRDDELVKGPSEVWIDAVKLGETLESVQP